MVRPEPADDGLTGGPWIEPRGDSFGAVRSLLVGVALVMSCNGLLRVALGVRAELEDFGLAVTGVVMAGYFLGFLFGTRAAEHFIASVGHIRVFAALSSVGSAAAILHVIWINPVSWTLLRLAYGLCLAGILVTVESWLNDMATNATRGRMLSRYMIITMGGMGAGQLMLNLADPGGFKLFVASSALISFRAGAGGLVGVHRAALVVPEPVSLRELVKIVPLGLLTAFWVGVSQGCLMGLGAFYARLRGPVRHPDLAVRGLVHGGVGGVPVAHRQRLRPGSAPLCDPCRGHHRGRLGGAAPAGVGGVGALAAADVRSRRLDLPPVLAGRGHHRRQRLARAVDRGQRIAGAGQRGRGRDRAELGGFLMAAIAPWAYFGVLIVCHAVIALYVVYRMFTRPALPVAEQGTFDPWPLRASAVAATSCVARSGDRGVEPRGRRCRG